ncbi:MAG: sigma-70 family RNA polymerase sigma factor, partial [Clostridia bacterium]|nr:sigma-70 family RNA polymerase sigma factor [Clostridia bacterium]
LISIGTLGLIKAVNTFRPEKCTRFSTYAARCVENEIFMHFRASRKHAGEISLDHPGDGEGDSGQPDLTEIIGTDDGEMLEQLDAKLAGARLRALVKSELDARETHIITARYGLDGRPPRTQREIAAATGLSRSYISRIEKRALEKLRKGMEK